jgi:hypothetical protein
VHESKRIVYQIDLRTWYVLPGSFGLLILDSHEYNQHFQLEKNASGANSIPEFQSPRRSKAIAATAAAMQPTAAASMLTIEAISATREYAKPSGLALRLLIVESATS